MRQYCSAIDLTDYAHMQSLTVVPPDVSVVQQGCDAVDHKESAVDPLFVADVRNPAAHKPPLYADMQLCSADDLTRCAVDPLRAARDPDGATPEDGRVSA